MMNVVQEVSRIENTKKKIERKRTDNFLVLGGLVAFSY